MCRIRENVLTKDRAMRDIDGPTMFPEPRGDATSPMWQFSVLRSTEGSLR
jgi:hypothetical protein